MPAPMTTTRGLATEYTNARRDDGTSQTSAPQGAKAMIVSQDTQDARGSRARQQHPPHSFTEYSVPSPRNKVTDENPFAGWATYAT